VGETRVDLLHLLEDLRDAYPGPAEETILTEIVANCLDSRATTITITADPAARNLALVDDGRLPLDDDLLTRARIYTPAIIGLRGALRSTGGDIHGLAHITGGGLAGNVPRSLPGHLGARIDPSSWEMPAQQRRIGIAAGMGDAEIRATFNGGIGMVVVAAPDAIRAVRDAIADALVIGVVVAADQAGPERYVEGPIG